MTAQPRPSLTRCFFLSLAVALCACGEPEPPASSRATLKLERELATPEGDSRCERWPGRATRPRRVVVSHPYDASGASSNVYQVLALSEDGKLSTTGVRFRMGRLAFGRIVFTPDGQVGLAAQDDGSIGVFRFDRLGVARVVHSAFTGLGYAGSLVMDPRGDRVYVLDNEWRESGGGIYSARIGCDGTLTKEGMLAPAKRPAGMMLLPGARREDPPRAVLAAVDVLGSAAGDSAHLLRWPARLPAAPTVLSGADAFGDDEFIVSAVATTADARYALFGDNSEFSGVPNRISVVAIEGDKLRAVSVLTPINDPMAIVLSPWNNAGLVVSGYGNAIFRLTYDPAATTAPFVNKGAIAYVGGRPQLPSGAELLERGSLRGRVLVAELSGVRQVAFASDGTIQDLGLFSLGDDLDTIVGAVGVEP
jgi:hypothetical protein